MKTPWCLPRRKNNRAKSGILPGFRSVVFDSFAGIWVWLGVGGFCCLSHALAQEYHDFITILAGLY
jgi:hypothetical protein